MACRCLENTNSRLRLRAGIASLAGASLQALVFLHRGDAVPPPQAGQP